MKTGQFGNKLKEYKFKSLVAVWYVYMVTGFLMGFLSLFIRLWINQE